MEKNPVSYWFCRVNFLKKTRVSQKKAKVECDQAQKGSTRDTPNAATMSMLPGDAPKTHGGFEKKQRFLHIRPEILKKHG